MGAYQVEEEHDRLKQLSTFESFTAGVQHIGVRLEVRGHGRQR